MHKDETKWQQVLEIKKKTTKQMSWGCVSIMRVFDI